jgi:ammonium transporter
VKEETAKANRFKTFPNTNLPLYLHAMFQGMFAIITVALISGAFAERVKFGAYCLFALLWTTLVYDPIAHWVWSFEWTWLDSQKVNGVSPATGYLGANGAIDFAGGTVVHIAAGVSGLAAVLLLRKRAGYGKQTFHPNSMILTLLGAGLLWFGWFGFNGGSALYSNGQAVSAFTVTQIAAATAGLTWTLVEWAHRKKPTALGFASGLVAGLVAITPASGFVAPGGALVIGLVAGFACYWAVAAKSVLGYDDSLDAFGIHGVGGFIGAILTGALVSLPLWVYGSEMRADQFPGKIVTDEATKVVSFDMGKQLQWQLTAASMSTVYAFVVTALLVLAIDKTIGFTVKAKDEAAGLDLSQHGEVGLDVGQIEEEVAIPEPKAAAKPPAQFNGGSKRFTVVIEGADPKELHKVWSDLCKPGDAPPRAEFVEVYKHLTTVSGNKFKFKGGDPVEIKRNLALLFEDGMDVSVKTHVEH